MAKDGSITRNKIIKTAMSLALKQGHVATSVDEIIKETGITKGTFFYHFPTKNDLATTMMQEFANLEIQILEDNMNKATRLSKDPLQQLLIFTGLIQELHSQIDDALIGCLFASYSYQNQLADAQLMRIATNTLTFWKESLSQKINEIIKTYPSRFSVNPDELADMFIVILEGAYILSRVTHRSDVVQIHLEQYKTFLESLFKPN